MKLEEYEQAIVSSTRDDWTVFSCWGSGSGPSYLQSQSVITDGRDNFLGLEVRTHAAIASYKRDLSISLAWGYPSREKFVESWANQFADPDASSDFVDFFFNGTLVFRDIYVAVDGGRCLLPLPEREWTNPEKQEFRLWVPEKKHDFFCMLDGLEKRSSFDDYFRRAEIEKRKAPWML